MKRNRMRRPSPTYPLEGWFLFASAGFCILTGLLGLAVSPDKPVPEEEQAPSSLHEVARELDRYLGKPCPWSREELESLRISITNLLEQ